MFPIWRFLKNQHINVSDLENSAKISTQMFPIRRFLRNSAKMFPIRRFRKKSVHKCFRSEDFCKNPHINVSDPKISAKICINFSNSEVFAKVSTKIFPIRRFPKKIEEMFPIPRFLKKSAHKCFQSGEFCKNQNTNISDSEISAKFCKIVSDPEISEKISTQMFPIWRFLQKSAHKCFRSGDFCKNLHT